MRRCGLTDMIAYSCYHCLGIPMLGWWEKAKAPVDADG